jgi:diacylglycerol kinase (ATP)
MNRFSAISIIFNPKSTGSSQANAKELEELLRSHGITPTVIRLLPTKRAGHAEELAYELALATPDPLIISASGDGGYNEVINGVMRAQTDGAQVVTGLLPSGNANDHYHSVRTGDVDKLILDGKTRQVDLLEVTLEQGAKHWQRYAHSYVGIGLTAEVGIKLNQIDLNPINEWVVTIRTIYNSPPSEIIVDGKTRLYDSLIFSNVSRLAKVFVLSSTSRIDDGKFEVIALQSDNKVAMLRKIAKVLTSRTSNATQAAEFSFETTNRQSMQMDGEIHILEPGTRVSIRSIPRILSCII